MLCDELKRLRKERKLTQNQLADALQVSQSTIASWENGTRQPTTDFIPTLATFYGISVDKLLGLIDETAQKETHIPMTEEAKIISGGIDKMPPEDRERALDMMKLMFKEYADFFDKKERNESDASDC